LIYIYFICFELLLDIMTDYYGLPRTIIISLFIYSIFAFVVYIYRVIICRLIYQYKNYQYKNHQYKNHLMLDEISIGQENKTWYRKDGRLVSI
jgi:hypothetical protein